MDQRHRFHLEALVRYEPGHPRPVLRWTVRQVIGSDVDTFEDASLRIDDELRRADLVLESGPSEKQTLTTMRLDEVSKIELEEDGLVLLGRMQIRDEREHHAGWLETAWYCFPHQSWS